MPDKIISSEYLTLEGRKFSTSRNWAVWVPYILERYHPDSVRYFLIANGPENRDADFSWREFIYSHNGELLGAFGNFVHRNLVFIGKSFEGKVPLSHIDPAVKQQIEALYAHAGELIERGHFKEGLEAIFAFIRRSNKYFDERKPWVQNKEDPSGCGATLYTCVQIIANLSNLLAPFLPFSCDKIRYFLNIDGARWGYIEVPPGQKLEPPEVLFERIDVSRIEEEVNNLS